MRKKVSIIVPVYKAQDYIKKCIESIINQTYENLEILLIDDGSPDDCGMIIDDYSKNDSRIRAFHIENEGVSNARNVGIANATGTYIQFVDSDDFLENDMVEKMVMTMESINCDMVMCGFYDRNRSFVNEVLPVQENGKCQKEDYMEGILSDPYSFNYGVLWNKLFKKNLIDKGVSFNNNMDFGEDFIFCLNYMEYVNAVGIVKRCMYNYVRYNNQSLMYIQTKDRNNAEKYITYMKKRLLIYEKYKDFFVRTGQFDKFSDRIYEYILRFVIQEKMQLKAFKMGRDDKAQCIRFLNENEFVKEMKENMSFYRMFTRSIRFYVINAKGLIRDLFVRN